MVEIISYSLKKINVRHFGFNSDTDMNIWKQIEIVALCYTLKGENGIVTSFQRQSKLNRLISNIIYIDRGIYQDL